MAFDPDAYLAKKAAPQQPGGFNPDAYLAKKQPAPQEDIGLLSRGVGVAQDVGEAGLMGVGKLLSPVMKPYEEYIAGPVRSAAKGAIEGFQEPDLGLPYEEDLKNIPSTAVPVRYAGALKGMLSGYGDAFSGEPAPSGEDVLSAAGIKGSKEAKLSGLLPSLYSETGEGAALKKGGIADISGSQVAEMALDPLSYIGAGGAARGGTKAISAGTKSVGRGVKTTAVKAGSSITGIPENIVKTYVQAGRNVDDLIKKYGKDIPSAADDIRAQYRTQIQNFKQKANNQITESMGKHGDDIVNVQSEIDKLRDRAVRLDPDTQAGALSEIKESIEIIGKKVDDQGNILAQDLYSIKNYLQEKGKSAYIKNGQIFTPGKDAARISKAAAADFRKSLNKAVPDVAQANNKLAMLHNAEDGLMKNLIKEGVSEHSLVGAGAREMSRQRKQLKRLEDVTGTPMVEKAEQLAAAKTFAEPPLLAQSGLGTTSTSRTLLAGGAGYLAGGPTGALAASALTSPWALKYGIKSMRGIEDIARTLGKPVSFVLDPNNAKLVDAALAAGVPPMLQRAREETRGQ